MADNPYPDKVDPPVPVPVSDDVHTMRKDMTQAAKAALNNPSTYPMKKPYQM